MAIFLSLAAVVMVGCHRLVKDSRLVAVDALSSESPMQAIEMLDSIDKNDLDDYNGRFYDFLTIKTRDKAYIDHTSDSLYLSVLDYFSTRPADSIYPEVLYYGGRVYSDLGDYPRALRYFQDALDHIPDENVVLKRNALSQTGRLLNRIRLYDQAIPYLEKSIALDILLNDTVNLPYDHQLLGSVYMHKEDYASAEREFHRALVLSSNRPDSERALRMADLSVLNFMRGDTDSALTLMRGSYDKVMDRDKDYILSYASRIYYKAGIVDTAYLYAKKIKDSAEPTYSRSGYKILLSPGVKECLSPDTIELYQRNYLSVLEEIYNENNSNSALIQNSLYNYSVYEKENSALNKSKMKLTVWLCVSLAVVLLLIILCVFFKYARIRERIDKLQALEKVKELNRLLESDSSLEEKLYTVGPVEEIERRISYESDRLKENLSKKKHLPNPYVNSKGYRIVVECLETNQHIPDSAFKWKEIFSSFNKVTPGLFSELQRISDKEMSDDDYRLVIMIRYGLSASQMSKILSKSKSTITYRRQRLFEKLFSDNFDYKNFDSIIRSL